MFLIDSLDSCANGLRWYVFHILLTKDRRWEIFFFFFTYIGNFVGTLNFDTLCGILRDLVLLLVLVSVTARSDYSTRFNVFALGVDIHYNDVIMGSMASQITSLTIVYSTVYSDADQRKQKSSASLAFVRGIHRWPVNSPHKGPVTRKMWTFDDVIMICPIMFSGE